MFKLLEALTDAERYRIATAFPNAASFSLCPHGKTGVIVYAYGKDKNFIGSVVPEATVTKNPKRLEFDASLRYPRSVFILNATMARIDDEYYHVSGIAPAATPDDRQLVVLTTLDCEETITIDDIENNIILFAPVLEVSGLWEDTVETSDHNEAGE